MYTNVSALAKADFTLTTTVVDEKIIRRLDIAPTNSFIVLINGVFNKEASRLNDGIEINANYVHAGTVCSRSGSDIPKLDCDTVTITKSTGGTIHVLQLGSGVREIVDMIKVAVVDAHNKG